MAKAKKKVIVVKPIPYFYIKALTDEPFFQPFRQILYHPHLSKLAKLVAFVFMDHPFKANQNYSIFARKLGISNASMSKTRKELAKFRVFVD